MKDNKKLFLTILGVLFSAILITGITFAGWEWASNRENDTNITFTTETNFSCSVDGGGDITEADVTLLPTSCTDSTYAIKREITTNVVNNGSNTLYMDLWLDIKKLSQGLSDSHNFRYALTTSSTSCDDGNILSHGTFNSKEVNDKIELILNDKYSSVNSKTYYLYIWLDYNGIDRTSQNEEFTLELGGECGDDYTREYEANKPYVYNIGLIPVKLSDSGDTVTTVTEDDPTWYSYTEEDKKWANAILVKEKGTKTREYYKSYPGTVVNQDDILAYYVWIPRYSYKVWRLSGVTANQTEANAENHSIDIKFIPTNVIDELPTEDDKYYTHPAFWWDNDNYGVREEGEELSGIWVGKFEVSHQTLSIDSLSTSGNNLGLNSGDTICVPDNCNNYTGIRMLPSVRALRYNRVSNFFSASRLMESEGNPFGLVANKVDSHMMKNSEWGAVAYLSRSKYGINGEVRRNNQSDYITGCGALTQNAAARVSNCDNKYAYQVTTFPQSTSGNVTGIFDMSGGAYEYVMGHYGNTTSYSSSGFSATYPLPSSKYYDNYMFNSMASCTLETCGGHALNETKNWYSDSAGFVNSSSVWFHRGDSVNNGYIDQAGVFAVQAQIGYSTNYYSSRFVLIQN